MQKTVDFYMDQAKKKNGLDSDRALSRALKITATTTNGWRLKRNLPSDETMIALADLAGMDKAEALLYLNAWRAKGPAANIYRDMALKIAAACFAFAMVGTSPAQSNPTDTTTVYYGK